MTIEGYIQLQPDMAIMCSTLMGKIYPWCLSRQKWREGYFLIRDIPGLFMMGDRSVPQLTPAKTMLRRKGIETFLMTKTASPACGRECRTPVCFFIGMQ